MNKKITIGSLIVALLFSLAIYLISKNILLAGFFFVVILCGFFPVLNKFAHKIDKT